MNITKSEAHFRSVTHFTTFKNNLIVVAKHKIYLNGTIMFVSSKECYGGFIADAWYTLADEEQYILQSLDGTKYQLPRNCSIAWHTFNEKSLTVIAGYNSRRNGNQYRVRDFGVLNIRTGEVTSLNLTYSFPYPISKEYLIFPVGQKALDVFNIENQHILSIVLPDDLGRWYHSFDQKWMEGQIHQVIAVANNILWVAISGHHLIGIDIHSGHLRHDLSHATHIIGTPTKDYHQQLPVTFRLEYDALRNQLFGFIYDTYAEVDLTADHPQLTMYVLEEACSQHQAFCAYGDRACFDQQYFYYLDPMSGKIGAVNRQTKTLDWVYSFPPESTMGILMQIQVAEEQLFVLDSGGLLHIFEQEETTF